MRPDAIIKTLEDAGFEARYVGGCVRDALLGRESADIDCEVYGLTPEQLHALAAQFGTVDESGARYGIFTLKDAGIDLAVPRLERRIGPKHGDFDVTANPTLSFEQAAARRDFTVNAILQEIEADRAVLLTESCQKTEGEPTVMRRAKAFATIRSACCGARSSLQGFICRRMKKRLPGCGR